MSKRRGSLIGWGCVTVQLLFVRHVDSFGKSRKFSQLKFEMTSVPTLLLKLEPLSLHWIQLTAPMRFELPQRSSYIFSVVTWCYTSSSSLTPALCAVVSVYWEHLHSYRSSTSSHRKYEYQSYLLTAYCSRHRQRYSNVYILAHDARGINVQASNSHPLRLLQLIFTAVVMGMPCSGDMCSCGSLLRIHGKLGIRVSFSVTFIAVSSLQICMIQTHHRYEYSGENNSGIRVYGLTPSANYSECFGSWQRMHYINVYDAHYLMMSAVRQNSAPKKHRKTNFWLLTCATYGFRMVWFATFSSSEYRTVWARNSLSRDWQSLRTSAARLPSSSMDVS